MALAHSSDQQQLARRLQAGDDTAWQDWLNQEGPRVWRYAARLTGADASIVADVVQDTLLAASQGISSFDLNRGSLRNWLLGIAHRKAAQYWRLRSARPEIDSNTTELVSPQMSPLELELQERADSVRKAVAELPEAAAAVLIGRYLDEKSTTELATEFGITEQAVHSRLTRARTLFREKYPTMNEELFV